MKIGKRLRHTMRYREILNAFFKNGFSHVLYRLGLTEQRKKSDEEIEMQGNTNLQDVGVKLRRALQELGPTFIKLGQMISSRRDQVPKEVALELAKLQDDVESIPYAEVERILEFELGNSLDELYQSFEEEPIASASIGQVHIATLHSGIEVAVKVQRPDIESCVSTDLEIIRDLAGLMESRIKWARTYQVADRFEEFATSLKEELDYENEGRNAERIRKQFVDQPEIYIPKIYWTHTTEKVLTMEAIHGIKITNIAELDAKGYNRQEIASRLADSIFHQVLTHGFFHGDPHPGNLLVLPNNCISYIDFGMVGKLGKQMRFHFTSLLLYVERGNAKGIIKTFRKMGILSTAQDADLLESDLEDLIEQYYDATLTTISLGQVIVEIFQIAYKHEVTIPKDITILAKVILTLEDVIDRLDPDFSIMKAVEPFGKKLIRQRYNPKSMAKDTWEMVSENAEHLAELPQDINDIAKTLKRGKLQFDINIRDLTASLTRLDRISNRLSFSIILLAFSILMAGLVIGSAIAGQTTILMKLPVIEFGFVIATLMFLLMVYTIIRSGRM